MIGSVWKIFELKDRLINESCRTQFEIECRCGGHSVPKKFMTILQILVAKPKLWKIFYLYKEYIFNLKVHFFLAEKWQNALSRP